MAKKTTTYTVWGKLYGTLVLAGKRAISEDENPDNLPVVPKKYREDAINYIDYIAAKIEADTAE